MNKTQAPAETLETSFVTSQQTAELTRILDLTLEDIEQVAGGECSCVNCCSHASLKTAMRA